MVKVNAFPARSVAVLVTLIVSSCTDSSKPTIDTAAENAYPAGVSCVAPPPAAVEFPSDLSLSVVPNPVKAGALATLELSSEGLGPEALTGAGVAWQCWNGSTWVPTGHQVVRGFNGEPQTIALEPGAVSTVPAVGLAVPNSYPILIPSEPPGTYRIQDLVTDGGDQRTGFVIVEVE